MTGLEVRATCGISNFASAIANAVAAGETRRIIIAADPPGKSGDALDRLENSVISRVVVTDTLPATRKSKKLKVLSVAGLFAEAIQRIHRSESISSLFEF